MQSPKARTQQPTRRNSSSNDSSSRYTDSTATAPPVAAFSGFHVTDTRNLFCSSVVVVGKNKQQEHNNNQQQQQEITTQKEIEGAANFSSSAYKRHQQKIQERMNQQPFEGESYTSDSTSSSSRTGSNSNSNSSSSPSSSSEEDDEDENNSNNNIIHNSSCCGDSAAAAAVPSPLAAPTATTPLLGFRADLDAATQRLSANDAHSERHKLWIEEQDNASVKCSAGWKTSKKQQALVLCHWIVEAHRYQMRQQRAQRSAKKKKQIDDNAALIADSQALLLRQQHASAQQQEQGGQDLVQRLQDEAVAASTAETLEQQLKEESQSRAPIGSACGRSLDIASVHTTALILSDVVMLVGEDTSPSGDLCYNKLRNQLVALSLWM